MIRVLRESSSFGRPVATCGAKELAWSHHCHVRIERGSSTSAMDLHRRGLLADVTCSSGRPDTRGRHPTCGLARWHSNVCPGVTGPPQAQSELIRKRISNIAQAAGAAVSPLHNLDAAFLKALYAAPLSLSPGGER